MQNKQNNGYLWSVFEREWIVQLVRHSGKTRTDNNKNWPLPTGSSGKHLLPTQNGAIVTTHTAHDIEMVDCSVFC